MTAPNPFTPPPVAPSTPIEPETPEAPGPDLTKVLLTVPQLRAVVLEEAGLDADDLALLDITGTFDLSGVRFTVDQVFPGTADLSVFAIFYGDQHDLVADHVPGDVRVYVRPSVATDPTARDWLRYTFNRTNPSMRAERLTQQTFVSEVSGEWYDKAVLADIIDDDDEPGGDGVAATP
jgi:hypothetical protein